MTLLQKVFKLLTYLSIVFSAILIFGRNNIFLGSALNITRWIIFFILVTGLYLQRKDFKTKYTFLILLAISLIFGEWITIKTSDYKLPEYNFRTGIKIKILDYNIFFKNKRPETIVKIINIHEPDIVLLQELTPDLNNFLNKKLSIYRYRALNPLNGTHGIGVFSKFPVSEVKYYYYLSKKPYMQCMMVSVSNKIIKLCNTHLSSPAIAVENPDNFLSYYYQNYQNRSGEFKEINKIFNNYRNREEQIILTGDFNTLRVEPLYRKIRQNWVDLHQLVGTGLLGNFPNSSKIYGRIFTLDYFFLRGRIKPINSFVYPGGASDHCPIIAELEI